MVDAVRHLRGLLGAKVEFEARYPAAFEVLFPLALLILLVGLSILFVARILKNAPALSVVPAGWNQDWRVAQDSGDAFSGPVATPSWVWATNSG